jgi:RecG-like helicase
MKRPALFFGLLAILALSLLPWPGDNTQKGKVKYYRVNTVRTVRGEITAVKTEKCYRQKDYTVIYLKEKKSGHLYRVEVSPRWYFNMDLMVGSRVAVTGSVSKTNQINQVMTRSIMFQGEMFHFRDKHGFPLWQGKGRRGTRRRHRKARGDGRPGGSF